MKEATGTAGIEDYVLFVIINSGHLEYSRIGRCYPHPPF
jgi:hypothetical protein